MDQKKDENLLTEYQLIQDSPINYQNEDILNYLPIVEKLHKILIGQKNDKSITIGLIGPWGNGKSSIIEMLKSRLSPQYDFWRNIKNKFTKAENDRYLLIHFLPYLNHSEDDLISEFFRSLSSSLRPYNGKLSNLIIEYSKRLMEVYSNKLPFGLFDQHITSFEKTSAKEMYDNINERLKETEKKIIVFVDDLDRLNEKEILQVLKLIRNSADFANIVFLVAMDKEYVVELLMSKKDVLDSRFIDKFFQLEVYLPAIRKETLRKLFTEILKEKTGNFSDTFKNELEKAIGNRTNLFDDYIKNIRDVKRTVNQIVYEYPFLKDAIDLKDFMNFTYFKLKFPKFINILVENRAQILTNPYQSKLFELKAEKSIEPNARDQIVFHFGKGDYNYQSLEKYSFYKDLLSDNENNNSFKNISLDDRRLVMKTLSFLFGSDNNVNSQNSIKKESNFMMLMQQRIFETHINNEEYEALINYTGKELQNKVYELFKDNKLSQLLDRFDFITPSTQEECRAIIEMLGYIYDKRFEFSQYDSVIFKKLAIKVDTFLKNIEENEKEDFLKIIKKTLFENENLSLSSRLFLITELWLEKRYNGLWEINEQYIESNSIKLYKEYLIYHHKNLWSVNNYEFYHIGNNLRKIEVIKEFVVNDTKEFWKENDIELLCAQQVHMEPWTFKGFTISENVVEVFGSKNDFISFVENHHNSDLPQIQELLEFFKIGQRTHFSKIILFNFKKSALMVEKIESDKRESNNPKMEEHKNSYQFLFDINNNALLDLFRKERYTFKSDKHAEVYIFQDKNTSSLFLHFSNGYDTEDLEKYVKFLLSLSFNSGFSETNNFNTTKLWRNENLLKSKDLNSLRLISVQPSK